MSNDTKETVGISIMVSLLLLMGLLPEVRAIIFLVFLPVPFLFFIH